MASSYYEAYKQYFAEGYDTEPRTFREWWFKRRWLKIYSYMASGRQKDKLLARDLEAYRKTGRKPF